MTQPDDLLVLSSDGPHINASGEIDVHTAPLLAASIDAAGDQVRLDLSLVEFVDSSGLRVLIEAHQRISEAGGQLTIVNPSSAVQRLFEISGVTDYLVVE